MLIQVGEAGGVAEFPLVGEPSIEIAYRPRGQVHQQLREIELRIDLVPAPLAESAPPPVLEQSLRYNGVETQQYVVANPAFPVVDAAGLGSVAAASLWRIDPGLVLPRVYQASATVERQQG